MIRIILLCFLLFSVSAAERGSIKHDGDDAETKVLSLVPNSVSPKKAKIGDAMVPYDDKVYPIEIKHCQPSKSKYGTINQVRAIKYIPLVIYSPQFTDAPWLVLSPNEIVCIVKAKSRGQHTEIPYESSNLSLKKLRELKKACNDKELAQNIYKAISDGESHPEMKNAMNNLLKKLKTLRETTDREIETIIAKSKVKK